MFAFKYSWQGLQGANSSRSYTCGYCGSPLASEKGFVAARQDVANTHQMRIYICHFCTRPTFFDEATGKQWPGVAYGNSVANITDTLVEGIYNEARQCMSTGSYTAAVMCCRKLLMHVAVFVGARERAKFAYYVDYLADNNFVPVGAKAWVARIKDIGNVANHEIKLLGQADAEEIINFSEMLLKMVYEFPARVRTGAEASATDG